MPSTAAGLLARFGCVGLQSNMLRREHPGADGMRRQFTRYAARVSVAHLDLFHAKDGQDNGDCPKNSN
jgi:hypothetical protein